MEENLNINPVAEELQNRTFTQEDVDRIVGERLAKEKKRAAAEVEQQRQVLEKRERYIDARDMLIKRRLPIELLDVLDYADTEKFGNTLSMLDGIIQNQVQTEISLRLEGAPPPMPGASAAPSKEAELRKAMGL